MATRRKFLVNLSQFGVYSSIGLNLITDENTSISAINSKDISWNKIRKCFPIAKNKILNLNSGSAGVMPNPVLKKYISATEKVNSYAPYEINAEWQNKSEEVLNSLASEFGINNGQLSIVRNTTEAINIVLWGLPLKKDDEIIYADWDYPFVDYTLLHLEKQKGIKLNQINETLIDLEDDDILKLYENKITKNTKLIIITWMTHREGRILPVKRIRALAKKHRIEVLIDGAHISGQLDHTVSDINPEYYATSLHKWLNAPLGTGLLHINKTVLNKISPPISYSPNEQNKQRKFDFIGTRAFQNIIGIEEALVFLNKTGIQRKEEYLKSLSHYWMSKVEDIPNLKIISPKDKICGINSFYIDGIKTSSIKSRLEKEFNIHVKKSGYTRQKINFIRVSPNIYCNHKDLDRLAEGIHTIAKS